MCVSNEPPLARRSDKNPQLKRRAIGSLSCGETPGGGRIYTGRTRCPGTNAATQQKNTRGLGWVTLGVLCDHRDCCRAVLFWGRVRHTGVPRGPVLSKRPIVIVGAGGLMILLVPGTIVSNSSALAVSRQASESPTPVTYKQHRCARIKPGDRTQYTGTDLRTGQFDQDVNSENCTDILWDDGRRISGIMPSDVQRLIR